jgi:hypothetical protein
MNRRHLLTAGAAIAAAGALSSVFDRILPELDATEVYVLWLASGEHDPNDPEHRPPDGTYECIPDLLARGLLREIPPEIVRKHFGGDFSLVVATEKGHAALRRAGYEPRREKPWTAEDAGEAAA